MTDSAPIVELKSVSKWFADPRGGDRIVAVDNVTLAVPRSEDGEFVALLGPSGCGKSTILSMIGGMAAPDTGEIRTFGKLVDGPNPDTVMVPQAYTCFPWLTVRGNVEFGLGIKGMPAAERYSVATQYLEKVGLADRERARARELSGGMQQRVAIARTLAMKLPIVLMDEPFGALDAQTRSGMQQTLLSLWAEERNLIVFVTHDISEALLLADRIIVLSPRPATIVQDLEVPFARPRPPELIRDPTFVDLSQSLVQLLKQASGSGQVRVSV